MVVEINIGTCRSASRRRDIQRRRVPPLRDKSQINAGIIKTPNLKAPSKRGSTSAAGVPNHAPHAIRLELSPA